MRGQWAPDDSIERMKKLAYYIAAAMCLITVLAAPVVGWTAEYILGEGDLLKITVYENEDLTTTSRISGEGKVTFPLIGEVSVSGLTTREVEQKLSTLLSDGYLIDPQVTVFVEEYRSKKATILGAVNKPGLYELSGNTTLLELISKAEGLTENAGDTAVIQRKSTGDGLGENIKVNIKQLMEKGDLDSNLQVQDGDSIFMMTGGLVYVTGQVNKPGAYKVEADTTVMKAIAMAGGLTDIASPGRTVIIRKINGKEESFRVDMGFQVQPEDIVSVPESYF